MKTFKLMLPQTSKSNFTSFLFQQRLFLLMSFSTTVVACFDSSKLVIGARTLKTYY